MIPEPAAPARTVAVVTLFPEMIRQAAGHSILGRAQAAGHLAVEAVDPRDFTTDRHRTADDYPFGGGAGMVMKPEPLVGAIEAAVGDGDPPVILMSPGGERFSQAIARELAEVPRIVLVCGHYEGIDERVRDGWITREISIGDYVLTGGELAALVVLDAVARWIPGVLGNAESTTHESFSDGLLEYPQYTRPAEFRGRSVPEVLLSGHHARIDAWRRTQALVRTRARRPDLWENMQPLSKADRKLLETFDTREDVARERVAAEGSSEPDAQAAASAVVVSEPVSIPADAPGTTAGGSAETVMQRETISDSET